jgi:hypothetical protein
VSGDLPWDEVALDLAQRPQGRALPWDAVADSLEGKDADVPYHSRDQIRRHWFAEFKRRTGYGKSGDYDNVILITAKKGKGQGKSACAFEIAAGVGRPIAPAEMGEHVAYRAITTLEILSTLSRGECVIYDEAGEGLLNTEFWSNETRTLTKAIAECRDIHANLIMCLPAVTMFNPSFRNALVNYWFQVRARGTAHIHPNPGERYTKPKRGGIGWYPDREWNPFTWVKADPKFWRAYSAFRRESRRKEIARFMAELENPGGARTARAPPSTTCGSCGQELSRLDALARHQASSCPGSSARRPAKR